MDKIVIVDYGVGNLASLLNMFEYLDVDAHVSSEPNDILDAAKLVLPGVGSFDYAMEKLEQKELIDVLNLRVLEEFCPVLGVCLGMQLMCNSSDEGVKLGLGWIDGNVKKNYFSAGFGCSSYGLEPCKND